MAASGFLMAISFIFLRSNQTPMDNLFNIDVHYKHVFLPLLLDGRAAASADLGGSSKYS